MHTPTSRQLARAATLSLALALGAALAACVPQQQAAQPPAGGWYASVDNPHPELPGFPKTARSENRYYALTNDPHATTDGNAPTASQSK